MFDLCIHTCYLVCIQRRLYTNLWTFNSPPLKKSYKKSLLNKSSTACPNVHTTIKVLELSYNLYTAGVLKCLGLWCGLRETLEPRRAGACTHVMITPGIKADCIVRVHAPLRRVLGVGLYAWVDLNAGFPGLCVETPQHLNDWNFSQKKKKLAQAYFRQTGYYNFVIFYYMPDEPQMHYIW